MAGLVHVGAWDGSEYINSKRRLLLFEPQAEAFGRLRVNLAGHSNVELVNAACGATSGTATMHTARPSHSSSLLTSSGPYAAAAPSQTVFDGTERVPLTTLDDAMRGREGFDTLRIDTQGYELEVLRGAVRTLRTLARVELELHDPETYFGAATLADLDAFMESCGWARSSLDVENSDGLGDVVYTRHIEGGRRCDIA